MDNKLGKGKDVGILLDAISYLDQGMMIRVYLCRYMYTYEFFNLCPGLSEWVANKSRDLFPVRVVVFNPRRQIKSITFKYILDKSWLDTQLMVKDTYEYVVARDITLVCAYARRK